MRHYCRRMSKSCCGNKPVVIQIILDAIRIDGRVQSIHGNNIDAAPVLLFDEKLNEAGVYFPLAPMGKVNDRCACRKNLCHAFSLNTPFSKIKFDALVVPAMVALGSQCQSIIVNIKEPLCKFNLAIDRRVIGHINAVAAVINFNITEYSAPASGHSLVRRS